MSTPRKTFWTARDLLTHDFPPIRWAVPGVLAEGLNLLAGAPKVGKSWAALNIAVAVATGGKAFSAIAVDQGKVLYLALEDSPRRLAERLRKVLGQDTIPEALNFVTELPPITAGGLDQISAWLTTHPEARFVVVDVFARIRGRSADRNVSMYDGDYQAMSALQALATQHSIAILVVHHTRKASAEDFLDEVNGSQGLAGAADSIIVLKRSRGSADAELHVTGRDVDEASYALKFDPEHGLWAMLDGPASDYRLGDTRQAILRYLRDVEAATPKQLATALGLNYNTAKVTTKRMTDQGQLDTDGQGHYFVPLQPVTRVTDETQQGYTGYTGYTQHAAAEVVALCGHPLSVTNTDNGKCGLCIVADLENGTAS